ncbi:hypothetical protein C0992_001960 [Termitomyces sp. T32_za158]|nr:hypothetical protein C0992_001960 [Termitomyces sp. T32_za158]
MKYQCRSTVFHEVEGTGIVSYNTNSNGSQDVKPNSYERHELTTLSSYHDSDADLELLKDKKIVFLGFGNQGAAQAQNLRDSGISNDNILIANRDDSYAVNATSKGFHVEHNFSKAAAIADVIFLLIPDQVQPRVFNKQVAPTLKATATIVIASGYNVFYNLLDFKETQNVVMVAPRMIGSSVRSLYERQKGFPCFVSVEQDGTGNGLSIALAISRAIGATRAGAIASSAREETAMDLFADEALCYEMWMSKEPAEIFERAAEDGFIQQLKYHSTVSQFGQLSGALALDGEAAKKHFKDILYNRVLNGKFCEEFSKIEDDLEKDGPENPLNELYRRAEESELSQAEKRNGAMDVDGSPHHRSSRNLSTDTHRTRRSHRSTSRERKRRDDERRRRSRSKERYRERDRSHDRHRDRERDRDRDRRRERDGERSHRSDRPRARGESRHRERDRERDRDGRDKEDRERRRKRDDDLADASEHREQEVRSKRKRPEDDHHDFAPRDSPRTSRRDRSVDLKNSDRPSRRLDLRDEIDGPQYRSREHDVPQYSAQDEYRDVEQQTRSPVLPIKRASPVYEPPQEEPYNPDEPKEDDSEARSVFVSQLAARLTARDLGYFFEDKLGEGTVMDSRIVTDRLSRRSKGIGYVEFRSIDLVEKALSLSGTVVMGLPIMVQLTESERNKLHPGDGNLNLPPGVSAPHGAKQLYVGSLHFNLTESDIKQVFEPFGELEFVDLHRDPMTGRSKGYAFVQYKRVEDARMALEQMEGFELAGRQLRVNTVHEKGTAKYTQQDSLDEAGGGNLNAASRQALMQKLARTEPAFTLPEPVARPNITQTMQSRSVLLKNMFDPEEETERDWDKDLAEDVKGECEEKYGTVEAIKVEKETQGEIYMKFGSIETAKKAVQGLNGRWFGGKQVSAAFISDAIMQAHQ